MFNRSWTLIQLWSLPSFWFERNWQTRDCNLIYLPQVGFNSWFTIGWIILKPQIKYVGRNYCIISNDLDLLNNINSIIYSLFSLQSSKFTTQKNVVILLLLNSWIGNPIYFTQVTCNSSPIIISCLTHDLFDKIIIL